MSTLDLLNAIVDKNSTEIFETFEQEMSARILDRLDDRRIEVAQSLFKENLDEAKSAYAKKAIEANLAARAAKKAAENTGSVPSQAGTQTPKPTKTPRAGGATPARAARTPISNRVDRSVAGLWAGKNDSVTKEILKQERSARKPAAPVTKPKPESGADKQKYVSTSDKPIIEQIGGIVDRIQANARNRGEMHELSYTDHNGEKVTRNILGEHAELIHGFHRWLGSQDNPRLREHKIHLLKVLESAPSDKDLAQLAKNIHQTGVLSHPSLQKESLMVEQYGPEHFNQADHEGLIKRDSLYRFHVYDEARKAGISFNDQHSGNPKFHEIEKQQYANRLNADQQHRKLVAAQVAANPKGSSYDKQAQAEHDLIANQRAGRNIS